MPKEVIDVLLVGGGIISATLASLIQRVEPTWSVQVVERLDRLAAEATQGAHNSGTGHAALCELNYTPQNPDGSIDISKAVGIHEQFLITEQYWAALVAEGALGVPETFINAVPHMSFATGDDDVAFLEARHAAMKQHHFFQSMEFSTDPTVIGQWAPLLTAGRTTGTGAESDEYSNTQQVAATYSKEGTDVDFGSVTRQLFADVAARGGKIQMATEVVGLRRNADQLWEVKLRRRVPGGSISSTEGSESQHGGARWESNGEAGQEWTVLARTVLIGAGGWTLKLLRAAGAQEVKGYGLLPISGKFLQSTMPDVVAQHRVKVYGKAPIGAPPMSVPHLDARIIEGKPSVLFGPFAGTNPRFLTNSSNWDFVQGLKLDNLLPFVTMGAENLGLVKFLLKDLVATHEDKIKQLQQFAPSAHSGDWVDLAAGQRAQIVKPDPKTGKGVLQFGTEVITSANGTLAGVLGASPGASTAVSIALDVLKQCYPDRFAAWQNRALKQYIPSIGQDLAHDAAATAIAKNQILSALHLSA